MDANENPILAFLAATDPGQPPRAAQYVARSNSLQDALDVGLRPMARSRVLLVGQTGIGKSTEIRALIASKLAASHTVLVPPVDQDVDLSVADWTDFLVYAAGSALATMRDTVMVRALEAPVHEAIDRLSRALVPREERKIREESEERPTGAMAEIDRFLGKGPAQRKTIEKIVAVGGPPEPTISQRFRNDTKAVHRQIAGAQAQFWDLAKGVFTALERCTGTPVVVVLDGLEKLSMSAATELFSVRGNLLANWPTRLLVTGPLGMTAGPWFTEAEERLTAVEHLRALPAGPGEAGEAFMLEIAERRFAHTVMDHQDVLEQIAWSGGIPRQFLQLLTRAAQDAAAAGLGHVPTEFHHRARFRLAQRWQYQLEPKDMKALASPLDQLTKDTRNRLLRMGALIEYDQANGSLIWKINPLVQLLLEAKEPESKDNA